MFWSGEVHGDSSFHIFVSWPLPLALPSDDMVVVDFPLGVTGCFPVEGQVLFLFGRGWGEGCERGERCHCTSVGLCLHKEGLWL